MARSRSRTQPSQAELMSGRLDAAISKMLDVREAVVAFGDTEVNLLADMLLLALGRLATKHLLEVAPESMPGAA
jgi:hypothetical protein